MGRCCRCLYKDKQEADQLKEAKLLEEEKAQFSVSTEQPFAVCDFFASRPKKCHGKEKNCTLILFCDVCRDENHGEKEDCTRRKSWLDVN